MTRVGLLIPFYNERLRFPTKYLLELSQNAPEGFHCYLIDDGSTDGLSEVLLTFLTSENLSNVSVIISPKNVGKANAIRFGFGNINLRKFDYVGFTDADFSAKPGEIIRLVEITSTSKKHMIFGARTKVEDNLIVTSRFRFLQGLGFNFLVWKMFGKRFLDLQCGLKFFYVGEHFISGLIEPFTNKWLFELELILRLNQLAALDIQEVVLASWEHVRDSKVSPRDSLGVIFGLFSLRKKYGMLRH